MRAYGNAPLDASYLTLDVKREGEPGNPALDQFRNIIITLQGQGLTLALFLAPVEAKVLVDKVVHLLGR